MANELPSRRLRRARKTPPHVSLPVLRHAKGLTLDEVIARLTEETGHRYTRGAISAIENGHRGASRKTLDAMATAYGLPPGAIVTDYVPRERRLSDQRVAS